MSLKNYGTQGEILGKLSFVVGLSKVQVTQDLDWWLTSHMGESCGTEPLTCGIWHALQVVSEMNWAVDHPVGIYSWLVWGKILHIWCQKHYYQNQFRTLLDLKHKDTWPLIMDRWYGIERPESCLMVSCSLYSHFTIKTKGLDRFICPEEQSPKFNPQCPQNKTTQRNWDNF